MIIKGASRAGPKQLAAHLIRTDTNERIELLELQSPAGSLREAFRDWQTLSEGTRGKLGLYHANIDPAETYTMTPAQWARAVDVLEEELGLTGQPRAVMMHEKHGRQHIHVVWARTDIDRMKLCPDSHNYLAHERASQRLEIEFGHELVPGKHAKRDRERQPEMPDARIDHAEWQQGEGAALDHRARKAQITSLFQASDSGPAFKSALEDAGYVLARGDKRDFVVLDMDAKVHSLGRQLPDVKAKDVREFMAEVDPGALPSVKEARADIRARAVPAEPAPDLPQPDPIDIDPPQPPEQEATNFAREQEAVDQLRMDAFREKIVARHGSDLAEQEIRHNREVEELQENHRSAAAQAIDSFAAEQARRAVRERTPEPTGFDRIKQNLREVLSDEAKGMRIAAEAKSAREAEARRDEEVQIMVGALNASQRAEIDALIARQGQERASLLADQERDLARRTGEEERRIALEREYERRRLEAETREREGPGGDGRAR